MTCTLQSLLDAFKLFHVAILTSLVGYLLGSPASLRVSFLNSRSQLLKVDHAIGQVWIAAQKVPPLPAENEKPMSRKKRALFCFLTLAAEYYIFFFDTSGIALNVVLFILFGLLFFNGSTGVHYVIWI